MDRNAMKILKWFILALFLTSIAGFLLTEWQLYKHIKEFNWAIQGKDPAISGCPHQYHQWVEAGGVRWVIGCWGNR
jgi:hypothetical protein